MSNAIGCQGFPGLVSSCAWEQAGGERREWKAKSKNCCCHISEEQINPMSDALLSIYWVPYRGRGVLCTEHCHIWSLLGCTSWWHPSHTDTYSQHMKKPTHIQKGCVFVYFKSSSTYISKYVYRYLPDPCSHLSPCDLGLARQKKYVLAGKVWWLYVSWPAGSDSHSSRIPLHCRRVKENKGRIYYKTTTTGGKLRIDTSSSDLAGSKEWALLSSLFRDLATMLSASFSDA